MIEPIHRIHTATIVLAIQIKITGYFQGTLEAIFLLEISQQKTRAMTIDAIFLLQLNPNGVDGGRILVGTDGKGGGDVVKIVVGGVLVGSVHTAQITTATPFLLFWLVFQFRLMLYINSQFFTSSTYSNCKFAGFAGYILHSIMFLPKC